MKNLLKTALVLFSLMLAGNYAGAQTKIGYLDLPALVNQLPETKDIQTKIQAYSKQFLDQMTIMNDSLKAKAVDYDKRRATMTDAERLVKERELAAQQKRIQDYSNSSQQQVEAKTNELAKPLFDKIRAAAALIAKEKGYSYVINSALSELIVSPPGNNMMADVKAKLGVK